MIAASSEVIPSAPRGVALSGVIFSVLFAGSWVLIRITIPADPSEPGIWLADPLSRDWIATALQLVPFTGLAFLWFMAALRNHIGLLEDRFFATVFLGSGFLFIAMLFVVGSLSQALLATFSDDGGGHGDTYRAGRVMAYALMSTFGMKMAAVFMFVSSTIGWRTRVFSAWLSVFGFCCGLLLLLIYGSFAWIGLLFPLWSLLVSCYILWAEFRPRR